MHTTPPLLIIADSTLLVDALAMVFRHTLPHVTVSSATRGSDALAVANVSAISVALIATELPDIPVNEFLKRLRWLAPDTRCLSFRNMGHFARSPLDGGDALSVLLETLRTVLPDLDPADLPIWPARPHISTIETKPSSGTSATRSQARAQTGLPRISVSLQDDSFCARPAPDVDVRPAEACAFDYRLTPRQREVLGLVAQGLRNSAIATRLHTSEKTVKAHVSAVFQALAVSNRTQATLVAQRVGLVTV